MAARLISDRTLPGLLERSYQQQNPVWKIALRLARIRRRYHTGVFPPFVCCGVRDLQERWRRAFFALGTGIGAVDHSVNKFKFQRKGAGLAETESGV
jgi:hypothetical protein